VERATFVIRAEGHELDDVVARDEVLRELACASGGELRSGSLGDPPIKPPRKVRVGSLRTVEVWSSPLLLLLAVALLAAEWTLRRRSTRSKGGRAGARNSERPRADNSPMWGQRLTSRASPRVRPTSGGSRRRLRSTR